MASSSTCLISYPPSYLLSQLSKLRSSTLFGVPAFEAEIVVTLFVVPSSFLMIFQTNIAYERYWEGRNTISSLVLNSHHLVRKVCLLTPQDSGPCSLPLYADSHNIRDHG